MKKTILIIDDDTLFTTTLSIVVEQLGYEPLVSNGGFDGLQVLERSHDLICCVLLDIYMPCIDGISVLGQMKNKYPSLPVIVISGSEDQEEYEKASVDLGALGYIKKPLDIEHIKNGLASMLASI